VFKVNNWGHLETLRVPLKLHRPCLIFQLSLSVSNVSYTHSDSHFITVSENSCEFGSTKYYALCGLGGVLSCGITHTAVVPLDLVKCRIQVNPDKYKSVFNGFRVSF
jgi:Mitochondrial carrier protein